MVGRVVLGWSLVIAACGTAGPSTAASPLAAAVADGGTVRPRDAAALDSSVSLPVAADAALSSDSGVSSAAAVSGDDAGAAPSASSCVPIQVDPGAELIDGTSFTTRIIEAGSISGGILRMHAGAGSPFATLGTLTHRFLDYHEPVMRALPSGAQSSCSPEISTTLWVQIAAEDESLLQDAWHANARMVSRERLLIEYEADVASLASSMRGRLAADPRTAGLDRVRFDFEAQHGGRAMLFKRGEPVEKGIPWFELEQRCGAPAPPDASACGDASATQTTPETRAQLRCVADAEAARRAFLYSRVGVGTTTALFQMGPLLDELVSGGRKAFFSMNTDQTPLLYAEIQRCAAITIPSGCVPSRTNSCVTCEDPGETFSLCRAYP